MDDKQSQKQESKLGNKLPADGNIVPKGGNILPIQKKFAVRDVDQKKSERDKVLESDAFYVPQTQWDYYRELLLEYKKSEGIGDTKIRHHIMVPEDRQLAEREMKDGTYNPKSPPRANHLLNSDTIKTWLRTNQKPVTPGIDKFKYIDRFIWQIIPAELLTELKHKVVEARRSYHRKALTDIFSDAFDSYTRFELSKDKSLYFIAYQNVLAPSGYYYLLRISSGSEYVMNMSLLAATLPTQNNEVGEAISSLPQMDSSQVMLTSHGYLLTGLFSDPAGDIYSAYGLEHPEPPDSEREYWLSGRFIQSSRKKAVLAEGVSNIRSIDVGDVQITCRVSDGSDQGQKAFYFDQVRMDYGKQNSLLFYKIRESTERLDEIFHKFAPGYKYE